MLALCQTVWPADCELPLPKTIPADASMCGGMMRSHHQPARVEGCAWRGAHMRRRLKPARGVRRRRLSMDSQQSLYVLWTMRDLEPAAACASPRPPLFLYRDSRMLS